MVGLVYVGKLLRMGCDSLLMPECVSVGGGGYYGNIQLKTNGGEGGGEGEAATENLII